MTFTMIIQLLIVLAALYVGSRYGSLALGAISGIGLAVLVFGFGLKPGTPPTDVIYIIIAAVTCAGTLQASGGMDWMIQIAEKVLRRHPKRITFLAPLVTFFLTVLVGTGHVVYTIMPIICDIALTKGIRPERPCGTQTILVRRPLSCRKLIQQPAYNKMVYRRRSGAAQPTLGLPEGKSAKARREAASRGDSPAALGVSAPGERNRARKNLGRAR